MWVCQQRLVKTELSAVYCVAILGLPTLPADIDNYIVTEKQVIRVFHISCISY